MRNSARRLSGVLLCAAAAVLFSFQHPASAWIAFFPVFLAVFYARLRFVWLYGGMYGALSYFLYLPWLFDFSRQAMVAACVAYFAFCALLFLSLKAAQLLCGRLFWIVQWLLVCAYEYLKTTGFAGFSYGVSAYSQWKVIPLMQCCDLFGVWGLSALLVFCSALLFRLFLTAAEEWSRLELPGRRTKAPQMLRSAGTAARRSLFRHRTACLCFAAAVGLCYAYGFAVSARVWNADAAAEKMTVAAIQHNADPWNGGLDVYRQDVRTLMRLTDEALQEDGRIALAVWPETAVVVPIMRSWYGRHDAGRFALVSELLEWMDSKPCAFVVGNYHAEGNAGAASEDYNCAFLFEPGRNVLPPQPAQYAKRHLVPFTEYFPYEGQFPWIYRMLLDGDTHLWSPGTEAAVFSIGSLRFAAPICFEDTFGDGCRELVNGGARAFVNLSNDAWSKSLRCQMQHVQMAVFRSVESHVPSVRSTASGQTCLIASDGRIAAMSEPFAQNYVIGDIAVPGSAWRPSLYDRIGDVLGKAFAVLAAASLAAGGVWSASVRRSLKRADKAAARAWQA